MLTKLISSCLLVAVLASSVCIAADDDLKTLVKNAVDAEVKVLDSYRERHAKNKLTKDEQLKFFGKNYSRTPKPAKTSMLDDLQPQRDADRGDGCQRGDWPCVVASVAVGAMRCVDRLQRHESPTFAKLLRLHGMNLDRILKASLTHTTRLLDLTRRLVATKWIQPAFGLGSKPA